MISEAKACMVIRKPCLEVFNAFIQAEITNKFWFTKSSANLKEGQTCTWEWEMYNVSVPVVVKEINSSSKILIDWGVNEHRSTVQWDFSEVDENSTFVAIRNFNFQGEPNDVIAKIIDSTGGFNLVLAGAKAYLEKGIQLNLVGDKIPH